MGIKISAYVSCSCCRPQKNELNLFDSTRMSPPTVQWNLICLHITCCSVWSEDILYSLWTKSPRIYHVCHFESTMLHTDSDHVRVCMTKISHRHHHNRPTNAGFGLLSVLSIVAFCVTQWNSVAVCIHKWWWKIHKRISQCRQVFNRSSFDTMVNSFVWWPQRATGTKPHQRFAWLQRGRSAHNLNGDE